MRLILVILFLLSFNGFAEVALKDCLQDAELYGNHKRSLSPLAECSQLIEDHPEKVSAQAANGAVSAYGIGPMFYVKKAAVSELMAGDQTELKLIKKIWLDSKNRRIYVYQNGELPELLTFDMDFIGNVTPLKLVRSKSLGGLKDLRSGNDGLELTFEDGKMKIINPDAESRDRSTKMPLIFK